jgi:hypothetical protein
LQGFYRNQVPAAFFAMTGGAGRRHRWEWAVVSAASLAIAAAFCYPALRDIDQLGLRDWDQHVFYHAVARQAIVDYRQTPGWNPYYFGGTVCLANPQARIFTPSFLMVLGLGEIRGIKIDIWLHLAIGLAGTYWLARHFGLARAAAVAAAAIAFLNSMYFLNVAAGHTWFLATAYGPWIWLCWIRSREGNWRWSIATGALFAFVWLNGGAYVVVILATLLALDLAATFSFCQWRTELVAIGLTLVAAASLGAIKLLPSIHFMRLFPRKTDTWSGYSARGLVRSLIDPDQSFAAESAMPQLRGDFWSGYNFGQDENGLYLGVLGLALLAAGLCLAPPRRLWLPLAILLWIMLGERAWPSLWEWLHRLPIFDSMRVAMRFRIAWILPAALVAGLAVDGLVRRRVWLGWAVVGVLLADLSSVSGGLLEGAFPVRPVESGTAGPFVQVRRPPPFSGHSEMSRTAAGGSMSNHYAAFRANVGVIDGYEVIPIPKHPHGRDDGTAYRGELYMIDGGSARFLHWSPNEWHIETACQNPDRLVVNQNYYPGWIEAEHGWSVESSNGLISVAVPAGSNRLTLRYEPPGFATGLWTTVAALFVWPTLAYRWRRDTMQAARKPGSDRAAPN